MGTTTIREIPVSDILIREDFNTRTQRDDDYIETLARDIMAHGLLTPIQVEPASEKNKFYIVAGHGRFDAVKYANEKLEANIKAMQAVVKRDLTDNDRDAILLSDRLARQLDPLGAAMAMRRWMERNNASQTEAAAAFHMTVAYAGDLKLLANAPEPIQEAVAENIVSATEAVRTMKEYGEEGAVEIVEELKEEISKEEVENPPPTDEASPDAPEPAVKRAKRTRKDTERVAANQGKKPTSGRSKRITGPAPAENENTLEPPQSLAELAEKGAYLMDNVIAQ
jgi:ParB/RepB/Spo0J family partition protein